METVKETKTPQRGSQTPPRAQHQIENARSHRRVQSDVPFGNVKSPERSTQSTTSKSTVASTLSTSSVISSSRGSKKKKGAASPVIYKTKIAARLDAAVEKYPPKNRSAELVPLTLDYDVMRKKLRALVKAATEFPAAMKVMDGLQMNMVHGLASLAVNTPLQDRIGKDSGPNREEGGTLLALHKKQSSINTAYIAKWQSSVVTYLEEWESVVTKRVDSEMAVTNQLNRRLIHYQTKVDRLRKKTNDIEAKNKSPVSNSLSSKLSRNELKLQNAWKAHEKSASKLADLIDEVTKQGWKDLYPVVKIMMDWRVDLDAEGRSMVFNQLDKVVMHLTKDFENAEIRSKNTDKMNISTTSMVAAPSAPTESKIHIAASTPPPLRIRPEQQHDDKNAAEDARNITITPEVTASAPKEVEIYFAPSTSPPRRIGAEQQNDDDGATDDASSTSEEVYLSSSSGSEDEIEVKPFDEGEHETPEKKNATGLVVRSCKA